MIDYMSVIISNADPSYKEFHSNIVPGIGKIYGVRSPIMRKLAKSILKDDWKAFLKEESTCYETTSLRALIIATAPMDTEERMKYTRSFVPEIDNWAHCDLFCAEWKTGNDDDILWKYVLELMESNREFMMRTGAVMILNHFIDEEHIDECLRLLSEKYHEGYYYIMGAAWALSFCYLKFPEKTESVLFSNRIDIGIRNKAVQKICESYRVATEDKERLRA